MSNRPTAAYGLAQMLASDPEMATRIKAWMDANPDAMDRRKQRKLLRDLEAAEAMLHAQAADEVASDVGSGLPEHEVPFDGGEAIDFETACDVEADGSLEPTHEVVFGQARTYGEATTDADGAALGIKPMHRHAWVLWCAVMAWFDVASRFAAMAVIGMSMALILLAHFAAFIAERNREVVAGHVVVAWWGPGPMHGYAWALCRLWRGAVVWRFIVAAVVFARGPPGLVPAADVILQAGLGGVDLAIA